MYVCVVLQYFWMEFLFNLVILLFCNFLCNNPSIFYKIHFKGMFSNFSLSIGGVVSIIF